MTIIIDADGATLGRLCTIAAKKLLKGEEIAIINSEKAIISGKKDSIKNNYKKKRDIGTYRKGPFFPRMPDQIVKRTIRGMIPYQTPHGRAAFKRLKCYIGLSDEFKDKKIQKIKEVEKFPIDYITVEELSRALGAKI
jgi:large subunit ribosomal protein L13